MKIARKRIILSSATVHRGGDGVTELLPLVLVCTLHLEQLVNVPKWLRNSPGEQGVILLLLPIGARRKTRFEDGWLVCEVPADRTLTDRAVESGADAWSTTSWQVLAWLLGILEEAGQQLDLGPPLMRRISQAAGSPEGHAGPSGATTGRVMPQPPGQSDWRLDDLPLDTYQLLRRLPPAEPRAVAEAVAQYEAEVESLLGEGVATTAEPDMDNLYIGWRFPAPTAKIRMSE